MGVLNVTPDSFSDGGRHLDSDRAVEHGLELAAAGALVVDVGGESTRPGSTPVTAQVEADRILPVIERLAADGGVLVSADTRKPEVARLAIAAGAHIVNDVCGLREAEMVRVVSEAGVPAVIMHMKGEPATMQERPHYRDVVSEVMDFLSAARQRALQAGIPDVVVDPGIGFGKTLAHNVSLLKSLESFTRKGKTLVGASRKGLIAAMAGEIPAAGRDPGSLAIHLHAASAGAAMVRVHDVAGHVQALRVWERLRG